MNQLKETRVVGCNLFSQCHGETSVSHSGKIFVDNPDLSRILNTDVHKTHIRAKDEQLLQYWRISETIHIPENLTFHIKQSHYEKIIYTSYEIAMQYNIHILRRENTEFTPFYRRFICIGHLNGTLAWVL